MKYVDEFRNAEIAQAVAAEIAALTDPERHYKIMEVCGGHTHTIYRHGIKDLLPDQIELVHGPGCPVCVLPMGRVDEGIEIAERPEVIFTCFGDMMRVPGSRGNHGLSTWAVKLDAGGIFGVPPASSERP